jgi:uncharacterized protein (DUF2147 family)
MRYWWIPPTLGWMALLASPLLWASSGIAGYWLKETEDPHKSALIKIYADGDGFDGSIVKLRYPHFVKGEKSSAGDVIPDSHVGKVKADVLNPDPALRGRPIQGMQLIDGFKFEGRDAWGGATIYNPEDGKTYTCKASLSADGKTLKVRGYVGVPMLGRTQTWTRVASPQALGWE